MNIINIEKPKGVVVAFGGQTAIKLTKTLAKNNVPIIGTSADSIDAAEDRAVSYTHLDVYKRQRLY